MNKQWKWTLGILAFCIFAPIVSFATYIGMRSYAMNSGAAVAAQFLGALRGHDYVAAHALLAPSEQTAISVTALQKAQEQIEKKHGPWISPALCNEQHPDKALDHITYFYEGGVKRGEILPMMVRVVRTGDGWRVLEYQYDDDPA